MQFTHETSSIITSDTRGVPSTSTIVPAVVPSQSPHANHMGGDSYYPENPLTKLKLVLLSSFLGEPSYYSREKSSITNPGIIPERIEPYLVNPDTRDRKTQFFEATIEALNSDFKGTLDLAHRARHEFLMRKSPMQLLAIAAEHPGRVIFNNTYPGAFRKIVMETCILPADMIAILNAWKSLKGSKSKFPSFLKRSFSDRLESLTSYHAAKYRRDCRDVVRICHPSPTPIIRELMSTGKVDVEDASTKWETLRSRGMTWPDVMDVLNWRLPHMAALRNLRGFAASVRDEALLRRYCQMLEAGVDSGKQFPFRYISAYEAVIDASKSSCKQAPKKYKCKQVEPLRESDLACIEEWLEKCIQKSIANHPKLNGDVVVLSDNSGSAWGTITSEYGTRTVSEIGNLSALITALSCTGRGMIGLFGDKLLEYEVDKSRPLLVQYEEIKKLIGYQGNYVGGSTENGIWLFFKRAMDRPDKYRFDHFFCYSDMQAGHGCLYGCDSMMDAKWLFHGTYTQKNHRPYIHVPKLLDDYRKNINPRMSCFMVQTAGYNDTIMPQSTYRGAILSGWTGKEVVYADQVLKMWDEIDSI